MSIRCAHCKNTHPSVDVVRICAELHNTTRPATSVRTPTFSSAPPQEVNTRACNVKCNACTQGTVPVGRGYIENGVYKGARGKCYRCNGKGWQTPADQKRNYWYDAKYRRVSA